jgi:hypothetical protein
MLHPAGKSGVRIDRAKYDAVRTALEAIVTAGVELPQVDLARGVEKVLHGRFEGSIPWYTEAVKLDLEARGVLVRVTGPGGPRWKPGTKAARARRTASVGAPDAKVGGILDELRRLGTDENRAAYRRQGVRGEILGVSSAELGRLRKRIKRDHSLALGLWGTGVHDAGVLATMIASPAELDVRHRVRRVLGDIGPDLLLVREYPTREYDDSLHGSAGLELGFAGIAFLRLGYFHGVGWPDCLIAATCIRLGLPLVTLNDKHFRAIRGLRVVRPY